MFDGVDRACPRVRSWVCGCLRVWASLSTLKAADRDCPQVLVVWVCGWLGVWARLSTLKAVDRDCPRVLEG